MPGPASDTTSMSRRWLRSRFGFTGTGLAQPITGTPASAPIAGRMIEPNGSMCGIGLSVSRPARRAVSSPNQSATTPCEISCRMIGGDQRDEVDDRELIDVHRALGQRRGQRRADAHAMQSRAAGIASSRASPIGLPHCSQRP